MTTEAMRERFEAWLRTNGSVMYWNTYDAMFAAFHVATLAERDRCAAVCDLQWTLTSGHVAKQCAEAIRKGE